MTGSIRAFVANQANVAISRFWGVKMCPLKLDNWSNVPPLNNEFESNVPPLNPQTRSNCQHFGDICQLGGFCAQGRGTCFLGNLSRGKLSGGMLSGLGWGLGFGGTMAH